MPTVSNGEHDATVRTCRVALVDTRPLLRAAVALALTRDDLCIVASCDSLADLTGLPEQDRPHVVVLGDGVTSDSERQLHALKDAQPGLSVVVVAESLVHAGTLYRTKVVDAVLGPHAGVDQLRSVIQRVSAGERLIVALGSPTSRRHGPDVELTAREQDVLRLMAGGASNETISADLGISVNTVRSHVQALFRKLGKGRRVGAVLRADELGLLDRSTG